MNKWTELPIRKSLARPQRMFFGDGDLDFIDLPAPIVSMAAGPMGIVFHCVDGIYMLTGDCEGYEHAMNVIDNNWRVTKLLAR